MDWEMPVTELNHYLVRASDIEVTKNFYVDVLGFETVPRPDFPFPGYWLGLDGAALVHVALAGVERSDLYYIGSPDDAATDNAGVIDHIAFIATDPAKMAKHFESIGVQFRPRYLPESSLYQIFVKDPNGIMIELNFFDVEDISEWSEGEVENYTTMPRAESSQT